MIKLSRSSSGAHLELIWSPVSADHVWAAVNQVWAPAVKVGALADLNRASAVLKRAPADIIAVSVSFYRFG